MKKVLCVVMALIMCLSLVFTARSVRADGGGDGEPITGGTTTGGTTTGGGEDEPTEPTQETEPDVEKPDKNDH